MWARVWKTLAAAKEALEAEACSPGEPGVGVNRKGSLGDQGSMPQTKREIVEVIQPVLVKRIEGRVAHQMVDIPVPPVMEEIMAVGQEEEKLMPQEQVQQPSSMRQPQILEETVEVVLALDGTIAATDCRCANASRVGRNSRGDQVGPA